jgi:hypothetical protein
MIELGPQVSIQSQFSRNPGFSKSSWKVMGGIDGDLQEISNNRKASFLAILFLSNGERYRELNKIISC